MESGHLKDLLISQGGDASKGLMVSNLEKSKPDFTSPDLRDLLIANVPLDDNVIKKVKTSSNLEGADRGAVISADNQAKAGGSGKNK
ncbi:MAG: hypothetical protein HKN23_07255 [Verrucomicrobiales bacterium]|nr:hypothetical protein [Verrucomicrobiales bacterium]